MSSLAGFPTPDAVSGLYAAIVAGGFGLLTWWLNKRGERPARKDAWQRQAEELRDELDRQHTRQVADLRRQLAIATAEIKRLNRLLNRERDAGDDRPRT